MKRPLKRLPYLLVWLGGVVLTGLTIYHLKQSVIARIHETEREAFQKSELLFQTRFNTFIYGLQGMAGVVHASGRDLTPSQLKAYADLRDSFKNMPGVLGYGFIKRVPVNGLEQFVREQRARKPDFEIRSLSHNPKEYFVIQGVEPMESNRQAVGLNVGSEKNRYEAAVLSMRNGRPALTRPIQLVQDTVKGLGLLFFYPIYKTPVPPAREEDKVKDLIGWVYAPIQFDRFMELVKLTVDARLALKIEDITDGQEPLLLYQDELDSPQEYEYEANFEVGQRRWRLMAAVPDQRTHLLADVATLLIFLFLTGAHAVMMGLLWRNSVKKEKSEEKFKEAESWRQAILNASNYSIIATNPSGIIQTFNQKAEELLGYRADEVVGKAMLAMIHDSAEVAARSAELSRELGRKLDPGFDTIVAVARNLGKSDTREWTYVRKDGGRLPVRLCISSIRDTEGSIQGYLGIAEDNSELKALEATVSEQQAMLVSSAKMSALGEMAGSIAHEINNPLAIIAARVSMMLMRLRSGNPGPLDVKTDLEKIEATTHRIGKIIRGLRTFSRDGSTDEFALIPFGKIVEETLDLCRERMSKNGVDVRVTGALDVEVNCRSVQISQVLMNLIGNAFDAIKDLPDKWIEISGEAAPSKFLIKITDSGLGIPAEVASRMLEPFFTTKEVGQGTGLGLSISKVIIEGHGGELYYNAKSSHTQFIIELPK